MGRAGLYPIMRGSGSTDCASSLPGLPGVGQAPGVIPRGRAPAGRRGMPGSWRGSVTGGVTDVASPPFSPGPDGGYHIGDALRSWTCAFFLPGGIQARVVRFSRLALCYERSCGTDVAICKIRSYGPATAPVPKLSGAEGRGDAGGVLILESEADLATTLCSFFHGQTSGPSEPPV